MVTGRIIACFLALKINKTLLFLNFIVKYTFCDFLRVSILNHREQGFVRPNPLGVIVRKGETMNITQTWKSKFFTIIAGQTVSLIGSSAVQFALIWWMSETTESAMVLSLAGLVALLPQALLGPFAGVWIDRCKRKTVVIAADLAIGVVAALCALYFSLSGHPSVWMVCLVLGLRAVGGVFHTPAIQALVPLLVPQDKLMQANGWSQFLQSGAFMLGPALGALLYSICPMPILLLTDLAGALAAVITMAAVKIEEPKPAGVQYPNFITEFREGIEVYRARPALLHLLTGAGLCMLFFLPLSTLFPLMSSSYFALDAAHGSTVEIIYAAGMMLSALVLGRLTKGRFLKRAWFGLGGLAVITLLCGVVPSTYSGFWVYVGLCGFLGVFSNVYGLPVMSYMQTSIPPEKLGRAFSLLGSVMSLAMPLGLLVAGPCAESWGVHRWFLISGIAMLVIVAVMTVFRPRHMKQE